MEKKTPAKKKILIFIAAVLLAAMLLPFAVSGYVKLSAEDMIVNGDNLIAGEYDCILVLGAGVWSGGRPSHMLADRLDVAIDAYDAGAAPKLLMSGDHGRKEYDEVNVMKEYAMAAGVPSEDVFMDHAGFSTYESIYRARDVFMAKRVLVVTQEYHLYRALYVARALGLEAEGISADLRPYRGQLRYDLREMLARCKDFAMCIFKPLPTYLGEAIPVSGSGDMTNDK
ncbi:MAG: YdcF family protein [Clostridia bacterium]|nr:YdcF family protein [Clostridia bacterium]